MKNTNDFNNDDYLIFPTFKDERIETFKKEECTSEKYIDILSSIIIRLNNIKQIFLFMINENTQTNENNYINFFNEFRIDSKAFLTNIFFLKRRINLYLDIYQNKIQINDYIKQNNDPYSLQQIMYNEYSFKFDLENNFDLFYDLHKIEYSNLTKIKSLGNNYKPNMNMLFIGMKILNLIMNDALTLFKNILATKKLDDFAQEKKLKLCKLLYIIPIYGFVICDFYFIDRKSIFNYKENKSEWIKIKSKMKKIQITNKIDIFEKLDEINKNLSVVYSAINALENHLSNNFILDSSLKGALMTYYFVRKDEAKFEADKLKINPNINVLRKVWGLSETKEVKKMLKLVLPSIEYRKSFYIKRNENDIINIEEINKLIDFIKDEKFQLKSNNQSISSINTFKKYKLSEKEPKLRKKETLLENENIYSEVNPKCSIRFKSKEELKSINKEQKKLNYIKAILIHNSFIKLNLPEEKESFVNKFLCCSSNKNNAKEVSKQSIILHIHGGGFITLSPLSHENYLRKIVNKTGIATLSVDYRLSPEYSFPSALDDVYQIYTWLIENGEADMNLKIKNIILLGDSAGGNLILSLVYILLIRGIKLPNLILLAYPSVKMTKVPLSLSYINSLYDPMLDYNLLNFCQSSYLGDNTEDMNPFLSPTFIDSKILKNLPKIKIYGGSGDPLRDDYVEFFHKLFKCNVDCQYVEYKYFPHGFLTYDFPFVMPQAGECVNVICEDIENYINAYLI